jgi:hypothetical protein
MSGRNETKLKKGRFTFFCFFLFKVVIKLFVLFIETKRKASKEKSGRSGQTKSSTE